jgi:hypothetical protein
MDGGSWRGTADPATAHRRNETSFHRLIPAPATFMTFIPVSASSFLPSDIDTAWMDSLKGLDFEGPFERRTSLDTDDMFHVTFRSAVQTCACCPRNHPTPRSSSCPTRWIFCSNTE